MLLLRRVINRHTKAIRAFALLPLLLITLNAYAADYYVDISNETGYTIMYMYVSPDKAATWEEDVLGSEVLADGESKRVTLKGYKSPIFDIRLVDTDNDSYTFWNLDVSTDDITVTLADLDKGTSNANARTNSYYIDITNNTGYTIMYVYVSPDDSSAWEEDILGSEVLGDGYTRRIQLEGYASPIFDVKLVDTDGDSYTFHNVDASISNVSATIGNLDLN
jgi:hypothetical protein